jgi:ERF superfamily
MTRSESITHLATALAKAQAEMPVAVFDATNPFLKSKYASLGAVIQASRPILAKHKLSLVQFPISSPHPACGHPLPSDGRGATAGGDGAQGLTRPTCEMVGVESILTHESGEFVAERILIPLTEEKGKSKVQSAGSTLTYLRRYSWASILGMYSDEDSDGSSPAQAFAPKAAVPQPLPPPPIHKHSNN